MTASTQTNQTNHFNPHVNGIGYLNRVRWVETKANGRKANPFLACSISALRGHSDQPDYTYFDLRVSGSEAIEIVEKLMQDVQAGRKVVLSFRVGDIYPHVYMRDIRDANGNRTNGQEPAALIKGRLLLINSITIDGQNVFRRESCAESQTDDAYAPQDAFHDQVDAQQPNWQAPQPQMPQAPQRTVQQMPQHAVQQAPRAQAPRFNQAPRQLVNTDSTAYQAGHAVGRTTRFVRNQIAA